MADYTFFKADTGEVFASVPGGAEATSVLWQIKPSAGDTITIGPEAITPASAEASIIVPTDSIGGYLVSAQFTLSDSSLRTDTLSYSVLDPLAAGVFEYRETVDTAWSMLEDLFDSDLGGPYLKDASLANFDKERMADLSDMALYEINNTPPMQQFDLASFPYTNARALLAKSLLIQTIKHLMRSYVEQPLLSGSQAPYFDRRDYQQRWQMIYDTEKKEFDRWVKLFKRGVYQFGHGALLIDLKSGRRQLYSPQWRTRGRYW